EEPGGAGDARGGVLHREPAPPAHPRVAAAAALLHDDPALPLHTLAAPLRLLLELQHHLHIAAALSADRRGSGQREQRQRDGERPARGDHPGICASSGRRSQTGFHSGSVSPTAPAFSATSRAKVWRTSSLSRSLRRYFRYSTFLAEPGRPKMFMVR